MNETANIQKVVEAKLVSPIVFRKDHYGNEQSDATVVVEISGLNYNGKVNTHYVGSNKETYESIYETRVKVEGLDTEMLAKFGTVIQFSEVIEAYLTAVEAKKAAEEAKKEAEEQAKKVKWEEEGRRIGMRLSGNSWGDNPQYTYTEIYKGKEIVITVGKSYGVMIEMRNNIFGYDSNRREKKFKSLDKVLTLLPEMLVDCKEYIDSKIKESEQAKSKLSMVQDIFGSEVKEEVKEHYISYGRGRGRSCKTTHFTLDKVTITCNDKVDSFSVDLLGGLTAEQVKQIIAIIK